MDIIIGTWYRIDNHEYKVLAINDSIITVTGYMGANPNLREWSFSREYFEQNAIEA
jgi:hypothetical protein